MRRQNYRTRAVILSVLLLVILMAIYLSGIFITEDMILGSFLEAKLPPDFQHFFGTDALGRDLFLRTMKGLSISITIGLAASFISGIIAVLVGIGVACGSKKTEEAITWVIDLFMGIPHIVLIMLISFALGRGFWGVLIGISFTHWCGLARVIRAEVLQLKSEPYVAISKKLGKSGSWIMVHHMLPHLTGQILVGLILMFPHAVLHEASLSFLGFGLSPEQPAIGIILAESMRYLSTGMWWMAVLPGLLLVILVLLIDKLGHLLRIILDPYSSQG